jgi:hypothetical protein
MPPIGKFFWTAIGAAATILAVYQSLRPLVAVDGPSGVLDELNPYADPFVITSVSLLPLTAVRVTCWPHDMTWTVVNAGIDIKTPEIRWRTFTIETLWEGDKHSVNCDIVSPVMSGSTIRFSEFAVVVTFRPIPFLPWRIDPRIFIFQSKHHSDNKLYWDREPLKEIPLQAYPPDV